MEIALITDTHFGIRNDSQVFLELQKKFLEEIFFPELVKRKIKRIIHGGDFFDRRKYINFSTLQQTIEMFVEPLEKNNIKMDLILGNHDVFYKDTISLNSPKQLLLSKNINVIDKPAILFDSIACVPWICSNNSSDILTFIDTTECKTLFGHFEINGFQMHKNSFCEHGLDSKIFSKFDRVFSGHFHCKSKVGNIQYLGSPHQATWSDYEDERGFYIFNTESFELEFIKNSQEVFTKIYYDENVLYNVQDYSNKFVKVIIKNKTNNILFEQFLDSLIKVNCLDVTVIEDNMLDSDDVTIQDSLLEKDTISIISDFIDTLKIENKNDVKTYLVSLYNESNSISN